MQFKLQFLCFLLLKIYLIFCEIINLLVQSNSNKFKKNEENYLNNSNEYILDEINLIRYKNKTTIIK